MTKKLRVALAQLNLKVGDIDGNLEKHIRAAHVARDELAADIIVFPELGLTGYPAEDLLLRAAFIQDAEKALAKMARQVKDIYCLVGYPKQESSELFNACALIYNGEILATYAKQQLPNYGVFDEYRYFTPGTKHCIVSIRGIATALTICEDLWTADCASQVTAAGAQLILSLNASPFEMDKHERRIKLLTQLAKQNCVPIVYACNVGGQDELIFDGDSMVIDAAGNLLASAQPFTEMLLPVDIDFDKTQSAQPNPPQKDLPLAEKVYKALVLSLCDYAEKNHFSSAIVGVSGGIDSALTLAIAVDALGHDKVKAVIMPSRYTSQMSMDDARAITQNLGVQTEIISIEPSYQHFLTSLAPSFMDKKQDITEENMQARCRAVIIMALSNKFGHLVVTTGNRSEIAVGYCTLYGDMAGGFAILKDVPKTLVYELAHYRNQLHPDIPLNTLERPPTAELAPDQKDEDSLPPYSILDAILALYLDEGKSLAEITALGFEQEVVAKVAKLIRLSEYKRRQAAIGPRIKQKSFGKDWRYPVTNGYKG